MEFTLPQYQKPDFNQPIFISAPNVQTASAEADGVAPNQYHGTSVFPEYFKINGEWQLVEESRMDCVIVIRPGNILEAIEFRHIKKGDQIILGRSESGIDGIFVNHRCFENRYAQGDSFIFRSSRSRETAFSQDYDTLYNLLMHERTYGRIVWVMGPACAFDSDSRASMKYLIENGFVNGLLAGNALATHDLEAGLFGTALGQDIYSQQPHHNGHYNHIDVINLVRKCGSIPAFLEQYEIKTGIMNACVQNKVPFVLTGSIRDDGPLPEVIPDVYRGQDEMRNLIRNATTVICLATQLHTIATGNMTPCFRVVNGVVRPLFIYSVDVTEFALNKLSDRGSLTATGIVTNVQDFIVMIAKGVQKKFSEP